MVLKAHRNPAYVVCLFVCLVAGMGWGQAFVGTVLRHVSFRQHRFRLPMIHRGV